MALCYTSDYCLRDSLTLPIAFAVVFGCDLANLFLNVSESIFLIFTISVHICLYSTVSAYFDRKDFPYHIFSNLSFIVVIAGKITIFITIIFL